jgi:hypothetical protein
MLTLRQHREIEGEGEVSPYQRETLEIERLIAEASALRDEFFESAMHHRRQEEAEFQRHQETVLVIFELVTKLRERKA